LDRAHTEPAQLSQLLLRPTALQPQFLYLHVNS